ncbi:receptor-like kinase, partial [Trifolium medium]|nr:receptor-like kinase [Trifolium medium]
MRRLGSGVGGGGWSWRRRLFAWEEALAVECCLLLVDVVLQVNVADRWCWNLDPPKGYTVSGVYHWLTHQDHVESTACKE